MGALKIQSTNILNTKIIAIYLNFVFHIKVKIESKYKFSIYQKYEMALWVQEFSQPIISTQKFSFLLKELRNCILHVICVWSLLCSVRVFLSLQSTYSFGKTRFSFLCVLVFRVSVSLAFTF